MAEKIKKVKANPLMEDENTKVEDTGADSKVKDAGTMKIEPAKLEEKPVADENANAGKPLIEKMVLPRAKGPAGPVTANASAGLLADQRNMKKKLENDEKFPIMIPLKQGEKAGSIKDMWINGFHVQIPKGQLVRVPQGVFEVLADALKLTSEAGADFLISRDSKVEDALSE